MSSWRRVRWWGLGVAMVIGLGAVVLAWLRPPASPVEARAEPAPGITDAGRVLLGGLAAGDELVGWTVRSLEGPTEGMLHVEVERDGVSFPLMVAAKGSHPQRPPVTTERYLIFYGHAYPPQITLPEGTIRATTHALARRVRAHESEVEVPGM